MSARPLVPVQRAAATAICFLCYFAMSAVLAPIGLLSAELADLLQRPITEVTAQFSWLTGGVLVGSALAVVVVTVLPLRPLLILLYGTAALSLWSLAWSTELFWLRFSLLIVGVCFGIGLAAAAVTIARLYEQARRASMLVVTDACFSIAGFVIAWLAVRLIAAEWHWSATYQVVAIVCAGIAFALLFVRLPSGDAQAQNIEQRQNTPSAPSVSQFSWPVWPLSVWLCIPALFLYTLGQYAILWWLPTYLVEVHQADAAQAGALVGQFWLGMFATQLFVAWVVLFVGVRRLVWIGAASTALVSVPLWLVADVALLYWLALLWGFANLALLKMVLAFATDQFAQPPPSLVSALLFGATSGTAVSPALTSAVVGWFDLFTVLVFGSACYLVLFIMLSVALWINRPVALLRVSRAESDA